MPRKIDKDMIQNFKTEPLQPLKAYVAPQLKVIEMEATLLITQSEEEAEVEDLEDYVFENNPKWF